MSHTAIVEPGRVQSWRRKTIKQHLLACFWDQLSNRTSHTQTVPGSKEKVIPNTVVHKVSDEFDEGTMKTTCLWVGKPNFKPIAGPNKAEGKERKLSTKFKTIHYNVQRFPIVLNDRSVGGDTTKFYNLAERGADTIKDLFVESTDYDMERALCLGADEWLTESAYWEGSEYGSEITTPVEKVVHPNIYTAISTGKVTWSATLATALGNVSTATSGMDSADTFDFAILDRIHLLASRTISPLDGLNGNGEVKWVLKLSDAQWYQLTTDTTANTGWKDLLKYTEKGFPMMMSGHVGVYKNMLILVSQRSAIFKAHASGSEEFQFYTSAGDDRVRAQTTNASTEDGTYEIAALMGLGAVGMAEIEEVDYEKKGFDYDFSQGMCGTRSRGSERMDLDATQAPTTARVNESSLLFLTSTTTAVA